MIKKTSLLAGIAILGFSIGYLSNELIIGEKRRNEIAKQEDNTKKFMEFYDVLLRWNLVRQKGRNLSEFFEQKEFSSIAIYGMKDLGQALYRELENSSVKVLYGIDRDAEHIYLPYDIFSPNEDLAPVDAIVVTAIHYYDEIEELLRKKMSCPIFSIEDVVWEL